MANNNVPRFFKGWQTKDGKRKPPSWRVRHNGKYVSLTKWGAPLTNKPKRANFDRAIKARDKFLESQEATREKGDPNNLTVGEVLQPYLIHRCPNIAVGKDAARCINGFLDGRAKPSNGIKAHRGVADLPFAELSDEHFEHWENAHPNWQSGGKAGAYRQLKAAFSYAMSKEGDRHLKAKSGLPTKGAKLVKYNPLQGFDTNTDNKREAMFTEHDMKLVRKHANSAFVALIEALIDLGCRPGELKIATTDHIGNDGATIRLAPNEWKNGRKAIAKGKKGEVRVIPLSDGWKTYCKIKAAQAKKLGHPVLLFPNMSGGQWTTTHITQTFCRLRKRIKEQENLTAPERRHWDELCAYSARHTKITAAIKVPNIAIKVIEVACGTSEAMIKKHYGHLLDDVDALAQFANVKAS